MNFWQKCLGGDCYKIDYAIISVITWLFLFLKWIFYLHFNCTPISDFKHVIGGHEETHWVTGQFGTSKAVWCLGKMQEVKIHAPHDLS